MATALEGVKGQSGRDYSVERVLQQKEGLVRGVYLAAVGKEQYVLKGVPQTSFTYYKDIYERLRSCEHIRVAEDSVPEQSLFIYRYLSDHLLSFAQEDPDLPILKRVLKDALRGIAAMHDQDIVHTDIKPNNILIQRQGMEIEQVRVADLEDSAIVPPGTAIIGQQMGNWMWRSPEAHAGGPMNKPTDMFSFGLTCLYAVTKRVVLYVGEDELGEGEEVIVHVLERQISYFADEESMPAFLEYLGDSPWVEIFTVVRSGFNAENPRRPIALWRDVDPQLKDLVGKLTNFNPVKRLTAHEALEHPWFEA